LRAATRWKVKGNPLGSVADTFARRFVAGASSFDSSWASRDPQRIRNRRLCYVLRMSFDPGFTLWLTGLPCAGKSTIAKELAGELLKRGSLVEVLDGDVVRQNLSFGLGFNRDDRDRNVRRIAFVANLLARNGVVVIVACVSPYRAVRDEVRMMLGRFVEIYVDCPLRECEQRDVKGMYEKARAGTLQGFTGVDDPYEAPDNPELVLHTDRETVGDSVRRVLEELDALRYTSEFRSTPTHQLKAGSGSRA
jgi:adenylylsulfate kinase